jgi:putative ABC transport system ATP-binding protein
VELQSVEKEYGRNETRVRALRATSFRAGPGEFIVVAGPSGSGKTTLLNLMGCVDLPSMGTVRIDGELTLGLTDRELTRIRRCTLGFVFQSFGLVPVFDVAHNIELPLLLGDSLSQAQRRRRVDEIADRLGLSAHMKHRPNALSGGEQQRVAIARALVHRPKLVLADEPTANLDSQMGESICELMREWQRSEATTFIVATHDPRTMRYAQRRVQMNDGRIIADQCCDGDAPGLPANLF